MLFGIFGSNKTKLDELKECWNGIDRNVRRKDKKESLNKYLNQFKTLLKGSRQSPDQNTPQLYDHILSKDLLSQLIGFCIDYQDQQSCLLDDVAIIIHEAKWVSRMIINNKKLIDSLIQLIIYMENQMKGEKIRFQYKNSFAFFLNEVTRLLLNYPELIPSFKYKDDFIIFSNLLYLLQMDELISSFEHRKYIRRSLIVCLSFDEIATSSYLENSNICEILVNKLCSYYQMLPHSFDMIYNKSTIEVGLNMNKSFTILTDIYFEFKDYCTFFNKICNSICSHALKNRLKYYLFNKFCIGNVQNKILSNDQKATRTHLQYIISMLQDIENSDIIDVMSYFLFGFNDQKTALILEEHINNNDENNDLLNPTVFCGKSKERTVYHHQSDFDISANYDHTNHLVSKISYRLLNSLNNMDECLNIISFKLYEAFLIKRPYLMVSKFIKPYVDFCLKQIKDKTKYNNGKKNYPSITPLIQLVAIYENYDVSNVKNNIESNMNKSCSFYMNYDIDFYYYYCNKKQSLDNFMNDTVKENKISNFNEKILEDSLNIAQVTPNNNILSNYSCKQAVKGDQSNSNNEQKNEMMPSARDESILVEEKLFDEIEEIKETKQNMNFLLLKNIHLKLCNYLNNSNIENVFLTNFLLTMISVPCLQFDSDLVECTSLLLDDDIKSKYSLLTVIRYLTQEIARKIKDSLHFDIFFKRRVKEIQLEDNSDQNNNKNDKKSQNKKQQKTKDGKKPNQDIPLFESQLEEEYQKSRNDFSNYIIFFEFLREFITTLTPKNRFENLVEDIYGLYSNLLDDYYNQTTE